MIKRIENLNDNIVFNDRENSHIGYCMSKEEKSNLSKLYGKYGIYEHAFPDDITIKAFRLQLVKYNKPNVEFYQPDYEVEIEFPVNRIEWASVMFD